MWIYKAGERVRVMADDCFKGLAGKVLSADNIVLMDGTKGQDVLVEFDDGAQFRFTADELTIDDEPTPEQVLREYVNSRVARRDR